MDTAGARVLADFLACDARWNAPASSAELRALETLFHGPLPDEVRFVYSRSNGSVDLPSNRGETVWTRMLSVAEAHEVGGEMASLEGELIGSPVWLFSDDNANYVGVYSVDRVAGLLTVYDHEGGDASPRWRTMAEFLSAVMSPDPSGERPLFLPQAPASLPAASDDTACDANLGHHYLDMASSETDRDRRRSLVYFCARLLPPSHAQTLLPFLEVDDIWIPEYIADVLGAWDYEPAVAGLVELAKRGKTNGDIAAIRALRDMRNPSANAALRALRASATGRLREVIDQYAP